MSLKTFRIVGSIILRDEGTGSGQTLQVNETIDANNKDTAIDKFKSKYERENSTTYQTVSVELYVSITEEKAK